MCINQEISLNTFLVGLFSVSLAYGNGVITLPSALYYMSFISMQLVEFFTWRNIDEKTIVYYLSIIAFSLIVLQPFLYIYAYESNERKRNILLQLYTIFAVIVIIVFIPYYNIQFYMSKASNGHLAWHWLDFPLWILIIWFTFIFYVIFMNKEYLKFIGWILVIGYIYYIYRKTNTWGSLWCWISNALSIVLLYYVLQKSLGKECKPF